VIVPLLELLTISGTGVYGFIMNVLSSVVFSSVAGLIYYYRKSMMGAVVGLVTGVCAVTAVMLLANLLITPYYLGGSPKDVAAMIPTVLLPFNLVKATLNAAIVLLLYKPISTVLKKMGFLKSSTSQSQSSLKSPLRSVIVTSAAIVIIAISLLVVFFVLKK
jgi:riboflavin transporter FmnP